MRAAEILPRELDEEFLFWIFRSGFSLIVAGVAKDMRSGQKGGENNGTKRWVHRHRKVQGVSVAEAEFEFALQDLQGNLD